MLVTYIRLSITVRFPNFEEFLSWESNPGPVETAAMQNLDTEAQQAGFDVARQYIPAAFEEVPQDGQVVFTSYAHYAILSFYKISDVHIIISPSRSPFDFEQLDRRTARITRPWFRPSQGGLRSIKTKTLIVIPVS